MNRRIFIFFLVMCAFVSTVDAVQFEEIKRSDITIQYEIGLKSAAFEVLGSVPSTRKRIQERVGLASDFPFQIVIFKNRDDFIKVSGDSMIAGFAVPGKNLVVLDLSQMRIHPLNIELITMHEITHLVLHHNIKRESLPKWFDEGIAEWVSGISEIINPQKKDVLKKAVISRSLIPFYMISNAFPVDRERFALAYEQSKSMIEYIEKKYGEDSIRNIISRLKNGESFHESVRHELSLIFADIESDWQADIRIKYTWIGYVSNNVHWIIFVAGALITVFGFIRLRKRLKEYPEDEEEEIYY